MQGFCAWTTLTRLPAAPVGSQLLPGLLVKWKGRSRDALTVDDISRQHPAGSVFQIMRCQDPSTHPCVSDVSFPSVFHGGTLGAQSRVWLRGGRLGHGICHPSLPST